MNDNKRDRFNPHTNDILLPPELLEQISSTGHAERELLEIMREGGGVLNVSELLVGYYKIFNKVVKKSYILNVLYRMNTHGLIRPTGRKGEYAMLIRRRASDDSNQ